MKGDKPMPGTIEQEILTQEENLTQAKRQLDVNAFDRIYYQTLGELEFGNWYGAPRNWMLKLEGTF